MTAQPTSASAPGDSRVCGVPALISVPGEGLGARAEFELTAADGTSVRTGEAPFAGPDRGRRADAGHTLLLLDPNHNLIGYALVLLASTDELELRSDEAYCVDRLLASSRPASAQLELLHRAEEKLVRSAGKGFIIATEAADWVPGLQARLRAGFRVTDYRPSFEGADWPGGARLLLCKSLHRDGEPFAEEEHRDRLADGSAQRVSPEEVPAVAGAADEIAIVVDPAPSIGSVGHDEPAHSGVATIDRRAQLTRAAATLIDAGYLGVGWAQDDGPAEGALVYRRTGLSPTRRPGRLGVFDEYSALREVVVNYDSFAAAITPEDAINDVAMRNIGKVDALAQLHEYRAFVEHLQREGLRVVRNGSIDADSRFACFARDSAFVIGGTACIAQMARRRRQPESRALSYLFRSGPRIDLRRRYGAYVEGGDIVVEGPNRVIAGIGQRTNEAGIEALHAALPGIEIVPVRHAHLHLDVIFTILGERIALVYEPALPPEFLAWLHEERYELVSCDPQEQSTLGCNVLAVGDRRVIAAAENARTNAELARHVDVITVTMTNIVRHGGGPRCLTCPVRRGED